MKDYRQVAIDIANEFKIEPFDIALVGLAETEVSNLTHCGNHLDSNFMKSLDNLEFLDSKYLSN